MIRSHFRLTRKSLISKSRSVCSIHPYLHFNGNAASALEFYKKTLNAEEITIQTFGEANLPVPEEDKSKIIHGVFSIEDNLIMFSDTQHTSAPVKFGNNLHLTLNMDDLSTAIARFNALSEGGNVSMPFGRQFWGAYFGMVEDKFGVYWMINCAVEEEKSDSH